MNALKAILKVLKINFKVKENDFEISDVHKSLVRDRIKNSNDKELLDWDSVKNEFDGI